MHVRHASFDSDCLDTNEVVATVLQSSGTSWKAAAGRSDWAGGGRHTVGAAPKAAPGLSLLCL